MKNVSIDGALENRALIRRSRIGQGWLRIQQRGFALVTTLVLMILITVIAVGMLTLSTVALRSTNSGANQAQARANAKLALMMAISDLQKFTGPDQRVTATAELGVASPPPAAARNLKWTGVWATTQPTNPRRFASATNPPDPTKPVVTGGGDIVSYPNPEDKVFLSDYRNTADYVANGQKHQRLAWLVSGTPSAQSNPTSPTPAVPHITLVEKGVGLAGPATADPLKERVTAPLVKINAGTAKAGGYAYWIGDESVKARIDQKPSDNQPSVATPQDGGMARLAGGDGPNLRFVKSGATTPYGPVQDATAADRAKLITTDSVDLLLSTTSKGAQKKNFHDFTANSESVLADARDGGLKKDLTSYINQPGNTPPPAIPNIDETGLADDSGATGRAMLPGPLYKNFGPNFLQLRNWYKLRNSVTGGFGSGVMDPVFLPTRASTAARGPMPDLTSRGQSVQPFVAEARMSFDFSLDSARAGGMALRTHVYPRVKLWNPYNVTLRGRTYLIGFPRYISFAASGYNVVPIPPKTAINYYGDLTGDLLYFVLEAVDIGPGECLFFSPQTSGESSRYDTANIAANVLSPSVAAGGTQNFYFDSEAMLSIPPPPAPPAPPPPPPPSPIQYAMGFPRTSLPERRFLLKDGGATAGMITNPAAQDSATYPIIHKLAMDGCGDNSASAAYDTPWPGPGWNGNPSGLQSSASHANTVPDYRWYIGARLRRIDENPAEQPGGYGGGTPGKFPITSPMISGFNVRSQITHRSNFCTMQDWVWWTVGPYIHIRTDQVITDPVTMKGRMVGGKCLAAPFGVALTYGTVDSTAMFEVPRSELPPFSLANFQHAQLGYQSWQPTYMVGNSIANGRSSRNITVNTPYYTHQLTNDEWDGSFKVRYGTGNWSDLVQYTAGDRELLIYDSSYAVNYALWDRYFLSTIPFNNSGNAVLPPEPVKFDNPRMFLSPYAAKDSASVRSLLQGSYDFDYAAYFLMNRGGFNINSTSLEAWRAFFSSMNDPQRPLRKGTGTVAGAFGRLLLPGTTSQPTPDHYSAGAWDGVKTLSQADIDKMAVAMVKNVKLRGPFLGLADFVNRRLAPVLANNTAFTANSFTGVSPAFIGDPTMCGTLQTAIEESLANKPLQHTAKKTPSDAAPLDDVDPNTNSGGWIANFPSMRNFQPDGYGFGPWKTQNAPGYLTQADILQSAGANITARGDTFVIRAYGDSRDAAGNIIARAWCEAVLQRTPDYVAATAVDAASDASGNNPMEPMVIRSRTEYSATLNPKITALNKLFGRRYVIKGFRWLAPSEI